MSRWIPSLFVLLMACTVGTSARGDTTSESDPRLHYQGAYWSVQGHVGLITRLNPGPGETPGFAAGVSGRLASILSLADVQISFVGSRYRAELEQGSYDVNRFSVGGELHLHPLFLFTLRNAQVWYWLAGIYGSIGMDLDITQFEAQGTELDFGWHIGAGMDVLLTDPEAGFSLWLGLAYRLKFLETLEPHGSVADFDEHMLLLTVGYRNHDVDFMRWPRPSEFYEKLNQEGE